MKSDSLDTNLLIRIIENDVPGMREKVAKLLSAPGRVHYLSDLALSEVFMVLEKVYKIPRELVVDKINFFLTRYSDEIIYNHDLTSNVIPFFLDHPKLSFNDCCLAYYAHRDDHEPLYTFDQKLAKQSPYAEELV